MLRLPCGRYVYEVTSGRVKFGPKFYLKGERLGVTEQQALSLCGSDQLRFICALPVKSKYPRNVVPGETLRKMSQNDMRRVPLKDLKKMAQKEYGLILTGIDRKSWIREITERKKKCRTVYSPT